MACKPPWLPNSPCPALAALPSMGHRPQPTPTLVPLPGQLVCTLPILMPASSLAPPSYPLFIASQAQDLKLLNPSPSAAHIVNTAVPKCVPQPPAPQIMGL